MSVRDRLSSGIGESVVRSGDERFSVIMRIIMKLMIMMMLLMMMLIMMVRIVILF